MAATNEAKIVLSAEDKASPVIAGLKRSLDGLGGGISRVSGILSNLGIVSGLGAAGFVALAKSTIDYADNLNDMSMRTGVAVKDLASLKLAAEQNGTSLEAVAKGMQRITLSIGQAVTQNNKITAEALTRLNITSTNARERLFQLADAYTNASDKTKVMADLQAVLGKSYVELLPLLQQGGDELRRLTEESESYAETMARLAPDADEFNDQLALLKQNAAGASAALLVELVPAMNEVIDRIKLAKDLIGEGGLFNTLVNTFGTDDPAVVMKRIRTEIALTEKAIAGEKAKGKDASGFEEKLKGLNAQLQILIGHQTKLAMKPPSTEYDKWLKDQRGPEVKGDLPPIIVTPKVKPPKWEDVFTREEFNKAQRAMAAAGELSFSFITNDKEVAEFIRKQYEVVNSMDSEMAAEAVKRLADDTEWARIEAEHMQETWNSINADSQEWADAGRQLFEDMMTPLEQLNQRIEYLNELFARGAISADTLDRAIAKAMEDNAPKFEKAKSLAEELGLTFTSAFEDAIVNGEKFSDVLQAIEQDIIKLLVRMSVTEPIMGGIKDVFGSSGFDIGSIFTSIFGGIFGSAKGNAFTNAPALSSYSGQIVSQPTVFPFATGGVPNLGLMGESGAEAILPLKRGAGGVMGVEAAGNVVVNVINNASGAQASTTERTEGGTRIIDVMIEQVKSAIAGDFTRGGPVAMAAERTYGLSRAAGAY